MYPTAVQLHAALGRGGYLIANFDVRVPSRETVWHLYDDDLRRAGFTPVADLGYGLVVYRKVADGPVRALARSTWDWLTLASPPRRALRRITRPVLRIMAKGR